MRVVSTLAVVAALCVSVGANTQAQQPRPTPVSGACGPAAGQHFSTAPTTDLCSSGTTTQVVGSGPWEWTCAGSNGGRTASCQALTQ
jgi:hypothetical protein